MKKVTIAVVLASLIGFSAHADENSRRVQVEQLLVDMKMDSMMDSMYAQIEQMTMQMQQQLGIKPDEQALFEEFTKESMQLMQQELGWDKLKQPIVDIYVKHYSDKEVADMVTFYQSESGRSMVEKMPAVMQESMMMTQSLAQGFMPKMQALSTDFKQKLNDHRAKQPQ